MAPTWHDLRPSLHPDPYVFAQVREVPPDGPFAVIREDEGTTVVLAQAQADRLGLAYGYVAARITLTIGSDLAGISCNVIAGLAHDHLFVDFERGPEALGLLERL